MNTLEWSRQLTACLFVGFISVPASQTSPSSNYEATEVITQQNAHFQPGYVLAALSSRSAAYAIPFVISCQVAARHNNEKAGEAVEPQSQN